MVVIAVEETRESLSTLASCLVSIHRGCELHCFTDPVRAYQYAAKEPVDIAYIASRIGGVGGSELATRIRLFRPDVMIRLIVPEPESPDAPSDNGGESFVTIAQLMALKDPS